MRIKFVRKEKGEEMIKMNIPAAKIYCPEVSLRALVRCKVLDPVNNSSTPGWKD